MTLRFKVGDLARLIMLPHKSPGSKTGPGDIVEIIQVGPFSIDDVVRLPWGTFIIGRPCDYIAQCGDEAGCVNDPWLLPIGEEKTTDELVEEELEV